MNNSGRENISEDSENPFGDVYPPGVNPRTDEERMQSRRGKPVRSIEKQIAKPAPEKAADFNKITQRFYEQQGYLAFRVDQWRTKWSGVKYRLDFLGLFDWMAIAKGRPNLGIQVCTRGSIQDHIKKMCSKDSTTFNGRAKGDNLRSWLEAGNQAVVIGWKQPGGPKTRWTEHVAEVTMETLRDHEARRRKP